MSPKARAGAEGRWAAIVAVLGAAGILAACALVNFEMDTHRSEVAWNIGGDAVGSFVKTALEADRELGRQLSGSEITPGGRNPFAPVPRPPKPRRRVPVKVVPKPLPVVNALVLGDQPQAVVTYEGREMTVGVGSRIDDLIVIRIDADGLHLSGRGPEVVLRPR